MGVIASGAVRAFEKRKRRDYRRYKKYNLAKLVELRDKLRTRPPIWNGLRTHQKACLLIGARNRKFAFFLDTGMGKTFLTLALYRYWRKWIIERDYERPDSEWSEKPHRWLVLVPNKTNKGGWVEQVKEHAPKLKIMPLVGSSEDKWQALAEMDEDTPHLVVETFAGLMHMLSDFVPDKRRSAKAINKTRGKDNKKQRLKWSAKKIDQLCKLIDGLILDESIVIMRKTSLPHKICYQIIKRLGDEGFAYELNATPFGRDPEPVWGQIHLLDKGHSLGETLGLFRAAFYTEKKGRAGFPEFVFDKKRSPLLHEYLADRSISYEADEGDLPKVQPVPIHVDLPEDAEFYAEEAKRQIIAAKGNYTESKNAFMRMRQVSSGWIGYKDDDTGQRASVNFKPNAKLEALIEYIETINQSYKWIVFHEFNYSGKLITDELSKLKIKHEWVYGKTKDPEGGVYRFVNDPSVKGLVLSNTAGSYGLNLQIAKYGLYFEAPVSPIIRYQTRKRYERQYSPHKTVFRVDFVVRGTYDQTILDFHEQGADLFEAIVRGRFKKRAGMLIPA